METISGRFPPLRGLALRVRVSDEERTIDEYLEAVADDAYARASLYMEGDREYALGEAERAKDRARKFYGSSE